MVCASGQRNMGYAWFLAMNENEILTTGEPHAPFDARATGAVPGEGVGVLLLKRHQLLLIYMAAGNSSFRDSRTTG